MALPAQARGRPALPGVAERLAVPGRRVLVEGLDYRADDPRCCPSIPRRVALALDGGRLVIGR